MTGFYGRLIFFEPLLTYVQVSVSFDILRLLRRNLMPVMSIVSCKIMQDEIVWILENDSSVDEVIVVENENIREFVEKLDKVNLQYKVLSLEDISSLPEIKSECNKYTVLIHLMELGLHRSPKELKIKVYETIKTLAPFS